MWDSSKMRAGGMMQVFSGRFWHACSRTHCKVTMTLFIAKQPSNLASYV